MRLTAAAAARRSAPAPGLATAHRAKPAPRRERHRAQREVPQAPSPIARARRAGV